MRMGVGWLNGVPQCPRCNRANPAYVPVHPPQIIDLNNRTTKRHFVAALYRCTSCHRTVLAESYLQDRSTIPTECSVEYLHPEVATVDEALTERPRQFLLDALNSLSAPSASIMASCSAIDAMLKERGIKRLGADGKERSLFKRIELAVEAGVLTKEMAQWAHKVRLDANDQRHADEDAALPTASQARDIFELATGLAEVLFVLPSKITREEQQ